MSLKTLIKDLEKIDASDCIRETFFQDGKFCPLGKCAIGKKFNLNSVGKEDDYDHAITRFLIKKYKVDLYTLNAFYETFDMYSNPTRKKGKKYAKMMGIKALKKLL